MDAFYNLETEGLSDISAPSIATEGTDDQAKSTIATRHDLY